MQKNETYNNDLYLICLADIDDEEENQIPVENGVIKCEICGDAATDFDYSYTQKEWWAACQKHEADYSIPISNFVDRLYHLYQKTNQKLIRLLDRLSEHHWGIILRNYHNKGS